MLRRQSRLRTALSLHGSLTLATAVGFKEGSILAAKQNNSTLALYLGNAQFFVWQGVSVFQRGGGLFGPAQLLTAPAAWYMLRRHSRLRPALSLHGSLTLATAVGFKEGSTPYRQAENPNALLALGNAQFFVWQGVSVFQRGGGLFGPAPLWKT